MPLDDTSGPAAPGIADQIAAARKAGYSDDDIASYLRQSKTWAPRFDAATQAGYSDQDIYQHLGLKIAPPASTASVAGREFAQGAVTGTGRTLAGLAEETAQRPFLEPYYEAYTQYAQMPPDKQAALRQRVLADDSLTQGNKQWIIGRLSDVAEGEKPYSLEEFAQLPATQTGLYHAGQSTEQAGKRWFPTTQKEDTSLTGRVAGGLGSMAPALGAGVLGSVVGAPELGVVAGAGQMGAMSAADTAEAARKAGKSELEVARAANVSGEINTALGAVDFNTILRPIERAAPGMMPWAVAKLKHMAQSGATFAGLGEVQKAIAAEIGREFYDPQAGYTFAPAETAVNALTGALAGSIAPTRRAEAAPAEPPSPADGMPRPEGPAAAPQQPLPGPAPAGGAAAQAPVLPPAPKPSIGEQALANVRQGKPALDGMPEHTPPASPAPAAPQARPVRSVAAIMQQDGVDATAAKLTQEREIAAAQQAAAALPAPRPFADGLGGELPDGSATRDPAVWARWVKDWEEAHPAPPQPAPAAQAQSAPVPIATAAPAASAESTPAPQPAPPPPPAAPERAPAAAHAAPRIRTIDAIMPEDGVSAKVAQATQAEEIGAVGRPITNEEREARAAGVVALPRRLAERPAAPPPDAAPVPPTARPEPQSGGYTTFRPGELTLDPATMQFKEADERGVTGALAGVSRWEPALANPITVWQTEDGRNVVVNGHQRTDLALRAEAAGQEDVQIPAKVFREADGYTAEDMRALGAYQNIAEGSGTAIDAAKVLRAPAALSERMRLPELPPRSALVRDANALARLSPEAFGIVENGVVPAAYAAHVGEMISNPAEQIAALNVLLRAAPATSRQAQIMVQDIRNSGFLRGSQTSLFGDEALAQSLVAERARVLDNALTVLRRNKNVFRAAVEGEGTLAAAGNTLSREGNLQGKSENERLIDTLQRDATRRGKLSDRLNDAARELAAGKKLSGVTADFLAAARKVKPGADVADVQPGADHDGAGHPGEAEQDLGQPLFSRRAPLPPRSGAPLFGEPEREAPGASEQREYDAANAAFNRYFPTYRAAADAHLAGKISTAEYLAARQQHDALLARFDAADAALRQALSRRRGAAPLLSDKAGLERAGQGALPGMGPSARQAQAARDRAGPRGGQKPANEGLFAPKGHEQKPLFARREPVATLRGDEIPPPGTPNRRKAVLAWALKNLRGQAVHSDALGADVRVNRRGIEKILSHPDETVLRGLPAIPGLIAHGERVGQPMAERLPTRDPFTKAWHTIGGVVRFADGTEQPYLIHVREDRNGHFFYDLNDWSGAGRQAGGADDPRASVRSPVRPAPQGEIGNGEPSFKTGITASVALPHPDAVRAFVDDTQRIVGPHVRIETYRDGTNDGLRITHADGTLDHVDGLALGRLIRVAVTDKTDWNLNHEAVHALRNLGVFTDSEWNALVATAVRQNWIGRYGIERNYPDLARPGQIEEAIAERFADFRQRPTASDPLMTRVAQRFGAFLERLRNALAARGFQTAEDVFGRMETGEMGAREPGSGMTQRGPQDVEGSALAVAQWHAPDEEPRFRRDRDKQAEMPFDRSLHATPAPARAADEIQRVFSPTSRPGAKPMEYMLREHSAELARASAIAAHALEAAREQVAHLSPAEQLAVTDRAERGERQASPALDEAIGTLRRVQAEWLEKIRSLGPQYLDQAIENYMSHIWSNYREWAAGQREAPTAEQRDAQNRAAAAAKRPMRGRGEFLKQRTFETQAEGMAAGLIPATTNPIDMQLLKLRSMQRFYYGTLLAERIKASGLARWVPVDDMHAAQAAGYVKLDDTVFQPRYRSDAAYGVIEPGNWMAPEPIATVFNNHFGTSALREHIPTIYEALRGTGNALNSLQLGFSGFHAMFTALDSMHSQTALGLQQITHGDVGKGIKNIVTAPLAPVSTMRLGSKIRAAYLDPETASPEMRRTVDAMVKGGMRIGMDTFYRSTASGPFFRSLRELAHPAGAFREAWQMIAGSREANIPASPIKGSLRVAGRLIDATMQPLMGYVVPRMKAGVYANLARDWLDRNPGASPEEVSAAMTKFQDSVDNRMGQLVYDNLFWSKTLKDVAFLTTRSVGWNIGTIRELAGAVVDAATQARNLLRGRAPELTTRMAYAVAMTVNSAILGAIMTYLATGRGPQSDKEDFLGAIPMDYFYPPDGTQTADGKPNRLSIPGYLKDVIDWTQAPIQTAENKAAPLLSTAAELVNNRDYYGGIIYHSGRDNPFIAYPKYLLKQTLPFSARAMAKLHGSGASPLQQMLGFWGIQPAPQSIVNPSKGAAYQQRQDDLAYKRRMKESGRLSLGTGP
jgi:hypothetical protein